MSTRSCELVATVSIASAAVGAVACTPALRVAMSGTTVTVPWPVTVIEREVGVDRPRPGSCCPAGRWRRPGRSSRSTGRSRPPPRQRRRRPRRRRSSNVTSCSCRLDVAARPPVPDAARSPHGAPAATAAQADAGQAGAHDPRGRRLAVRAEVGRLPLRRVPRRRRHRAGQPQRAAVHPLLPRAARSAPRLAPRALRRRRRDRRRRPGGPRSRLRRPAAAHPPGRVPRAPPGRRDAGVVRRLRPARPRRRRAARASAVGAPRGAAAASCGRTRRCT